MEKVLNKIKQFLKYPWACIINHSGILVFPLYQKFIVPHKVRIIKNKLQITVVFVIEELGSWKTESLYLSMLEHPRFKPYLLLLPEVSAHYANGILIHYLNQRGYNYTTLEKNEKIWYKFHPDIIFYQKPYGGIIPDELFFQYNLRSLFCYVPYCFRNRCHPGLNDIVYTFYTWQVYAENRTVIDELKPVLRNKATNMVLTGLPFMDDLLKNKEAFPNPWKSIPYGKKRIIYAPHHTISTESYKSTSLYDYSTFFQYADFMLEMAEKYCNETQWAFKPHPLLKMKLYKVWGEDKTDAYYKRWENLENSQLEEGEYLGLFKNSDAMIHDCASFKLEYLYTGNPVLYLNKDDQEFDYPNWQTREALKLHYHASSKDEIESFIVDVINGKDPLKQERDNFVSQYLTPPYGKTACENIINAILGEAEYSN